MDTANVDRAVRAMLRAAGRASGCYAHHSL
jgi:hypothetical protein